MVVGEKRGGKKWEKEVGEPVYLLNQTPHLGGRLILSESLSGCSSFTKYEQVRAWEGAFAYPHGSVSRSRKPQTSKKHRKQSAHTNPHFRFLPGKSALTLATEMCSPDCKP